MGAASARSVAATGCERPSARTGHCVLGAAPDPHLRRAGWTRPDIGVTRWLQGGRPTDQPALAVLDRWWGEEALALSAWAERGATLDHFSGCIAEATHS